MTRKATMKWMKVVTFILALVLVVSFMPASVFAEDGDDNTIKVYMTISDKGTIAKTNDGDAMAWKEVTVSDLDGSGDFTYDEALKAAHKAYNSEDGFVVKSSGWVDSLWGVANNPASYYFTQNGKATDLTTTTKIAEGDYLLAAISLDTEISADWACSFDQFETKVTAGEELSLNLTGFASMTMAEATPSEDVSVGIWEDGTYTEKAKTDENGNVKLTFDKPGTYVVTAQGIASTVFEQTDEYYPFMKVDNDVNGEPIWGKMDWSTYESFVAYTEEDLARAPILMIRLNG